jgi:type IV pilus assembly protein PilC
LPTYIYKARNGTGKPVKGAMESASKEALIDKLHKMGYMTTRVAETLPGINIESVFEKLKRISTEDMIIFYIQLANLINAGIPILTSLTTLHKQIENKRLKDIVGNISRNIEAGDSFSVSTGRYPMVFSNLFVNMVKAGEASGKLDNILTRFAEFSERQADLSQKVKGALFYPVILLIAGIAVTLFIITFIIPQFAEIFIKTGIALPAPTLILFKIGIWIKRFWYVAISLVLITWLGIKRYTKTDKGRLNFDRFKLRMPLFGSLYRKAAISRFARTLGTLVGSGVPILQSLDIVKEVAENEVMARVIGNVRNSVEKGERIAEPLKISEEFPPDTVQMISAGEESGNLDGMLNKISDLYDMSLGYTIKKLTTIIEPLFLLIMGAMVGFIMASMLLPIFDMIKILRH